MGTIEEDISSTVKSKQAVVVATFILYLIYVVGLLLKYLMQYKNRTDDTESYGSFVNDIIYRGFFFIFLALVSSI